MQPVLHRAGATRDSPGRLSLGKSFGKMLESVIVCSASKKEEREEKSFLLPIDAFEHY